MEKVRKILFVSCSAGAGHKRAAEALRLTCAKTYPDIEARHIDLIDYSSGLIKKSASGYHFMAKHMPEFYGLLYAASDFTLAAKMLNFFSSLLKINTVKLNRFVSDFAPDRILCTHFLASALLKKHAGATPMDMLITDYELNKVVLDPNVRNFFAPINDVASEISALGRTAYATGIPIHPDFFAERDAQKTFSDFGLNDKWPIILMMSGGIGLNDYSKLVKIIVKKMHKINVIAVTGKNNKKLLDKIKKIKPPQDVNLKTIDFTDRIDELIRVSDLVITKPGGLTVTECLHLKKPLLLVSPIPGQEEANVRFVEQKNYGRLITDHNLICDYISDIVNSRLTFSVPTLPSSAAESIIERLLS